MRTYQCHVCRGEGHVMNPQHTLWQRCPMCEGAGAIQAVPGKRPAFYPLQLVVPANGTLPGSIQINGTNDFECQILMATYTSGSLLITIQDYSAGVSWMIAPNQNTNSGIVPITLVAGNAQLPFPLRPAYRIPKNNTMTVIATDQSGAQNTLNFVMYGNSLIENEQAAA